MINFTRDQFRRCAHRSELLRLRCWRFSAYDAYCVVHERHTR